MTDAELIGLLQARLAAGRTAALVTVTGFEGSVPRRTGAKMLVFPDGSAAGTIGGGRLEAQAIDDALAALAEGRARRLQYDLEPKTLGMYCAGRAEVFIDVFGAALRLIILGAGHVGEKTAALARFLGIKHCVVDDRPEYATPARFPAAFEILVSQPDAALKRLNVDEKTAVAIVTRCHGFDLRCLLAAMKTPAFYIGMISSRAKKERLFSVCRRRGIDPDADPRVRAPIGLDLGGRSPEEIALSVLAEITMARHGACGLPLSRIQSHRSLVP